MKAKPVGGFTVDKWISLSKTLRICLIGYVGLMIVWMVFDFVYWEPFAPEKIVWSPEAVAGVALETAGIVMTGILMALCIRQMDSGKLERLKPICLSLLAITFCTAL